MRLTLAVALAALLAACGTSIEEGMDTANDLLYHKEYVESERLYRKLLRRIEDQGRNLSDSQENERLAVLDRLGKLNALYLHDYDAAIKFYRQLVKLYPRTDQAMAALATVADVYQHKIGNVPAAIEVYQELVRGFPESSEALRARLKIAHAYFELKNYDQARREAEALIAKAPSSNEAAQAQFEIANSFYLQERYAEAVASYEHLLAAQPERELTALVLFELGNCFQETGEMSRALAYYYACLLDHPDPMLVQRKIKRVRKRIDNTKPADVELPAYLRDRLAAIKGLPFGVHLAKGEAPEGRTGIDAEQPMDQPRRKESAVTAPTTSQPKKKAAPKPEIAPGDRPPEETPTPSEEPQREPPTPPKPPIEAPPPTDPAPASEPPKPVPPPPVKEPTTPPPAEMAP